jgi:hypothetical protein
MPRRLRSYAGACVLAPFAVINPFATTNFICCTLNDIEFSFEAACISMVSTKQSQTSYRTPLLLLLLLPPLLLLLLQMVAILTAKSLKIFPPILWMP